MNNIICAFVDKDFNYKTEEMLDFEAGLLTLNKEYFSIRVDNEYYIFFDRKVYVEENMDKITKLLIKLNFELMIQNQK